jgi:predicted RNase H-like HicB family nuclease
MHEISRFYGLIIFMYPKDHLPPHLHAKYGEYWAEMSILTGEIIVGKLPKRAVRLVEDWIELHKDELLENWNESTKENPNFKKIEPLN